MTDFTARRTTMVDTQVRPSDVTKFPIIEAMLLVPREEFVPTAQREAAYVGGNMDLGQARVILEPRTLAKMLDALEITPDDLVLDIGASFGYSAAVLAHMAQAVVALEEDESMAKEAQEALLANNVDNAIVQTGALTGGAPEHAPFDVIVVQGGVQEIPGAITDQLKDGGQIAALFVDGALGEIRVGLKANDTVTWRKAFHAGAPILPGFEKHAAFTF